MGQCRQYHLESFSLKYLFFGGQYLYFADTAANEKEHGKIALEKMSALDDFIVYKKDTLYQVLKEFVDTH